MNLSATHPLMLFLTGVIFVKQTSLTFVKTVTRGTSVSLRCSNILIENSYVAWYKQTNGSLPLCIVTQFMGKNPTDAIYLNDFKSSHIKMSVNRTFFSLKIINVDVSDSGTFYCGSFIMNHIEFHNETQLVVVNETVQFKEDTANEDCGKTQETSCHIYYTLTLVLSGLVLLATVFAIAVLIRLKRGDNRETNKQLQNKEQEEDLNYAALNLDKRSRRPVRNMMKVEPNVVYAATR